MYKTIKALLYVGIMSFIVFHGKGHTQENNKKEFLLKAWEYSTRLIQTAECKYTVEIQQKWYKHPPAVEKTGFFTYEDYKNVPYVEEKRKAYTAEWKYKKNREVVHYINHTEKDRYGEIYRDGEKMIIIHGNHASITRLGPQSTEIYSVKSPSSVLFHFWPGVLLEKILSSENVKLRDIEYVDGKECYPIVYQYTESPHTCYTFFLSSENFLPVKIEIRISPKIRAIATILYKKIGEVWFPQKISGYSETSRGKIGKTEINLTEIKINHEIDDKIFKYEFKPGMNVYDSTTGIRFTVPGK